MTIDIKRARELAEKATREPWYARGRHLSLVPDNSGMGAMLHTNHIGIASTIEDAAFIAFARTAVPELCDEVERLRAADDFDHRGILVDKLKVEAKHLRAENVAMRPVVEAACAVTISNHNSVYRLLDAVDAYLAARPPVSFSAQSLGSISFRADGSATIVEADGTTTEVKKP